MRRDEKTALQSQSNNRNRVLSLRPYQWMGRIWNKFEPQNMNKLKKKAINPPKDKNKLHTDQQI